jgi:hypothetical protein
LIDFGEMDDVWTMQDPQRQTHHLQILTPRRRTDITRLRADIIDNRLLKPGDKEMRSLFNNLLLDSRQTVKNDGSCPALDIVNRPRKFRQPRPHQGREREKEEQSGGEYAWPTARAIAAGMARREPSPRIRSITVEEEVVELWWCACEVFWPLVGFGIFFFRRGWTD